MCPTLFCRCLIHQLPYLAIRLSSPYVCLLSHLSSILCRRLSWLEWLEFVHYIPSILFSHYEGSYGPCFDALACHVRQLLTVVVKFLSVSMLFHNDIDVTLYHDQYCYSRIQYNLKTFTNFQKTLTNFI